MSEFEQKPSVEVELPKSKSQLKREADGLKKLGERLVTLKNEQLDRLNLPANLHQAVLEAKRITSHGAKRRQAQYIGRLMRGLADIALIEEFFDKLDMKDQRATVLHHKLESWRERLISDDVDALTQFIQEYPNVDRQHLRQLIANAKKQYLTGNCKGAQKALFRYLRELQIQKEGRA